MSAPNTIFTGQVELVRAVAGMREEHSPVGAASVLRRVGRATIVDGPIWGRKRTIRLSNEGPGVRLPALDRLRVGDQIDLASSVWHRRVIPVGVDPDPSSWPRIVVSPQGRQAFRFETGGYVQDGYSPYALMAFRMYAGFAGYPDLPVIAHWRQVYTCIVVGITRSGSSTGTGQGWSLDLEEVVPS